MLGALGPVVVINDGIVERAISLAAAPRPRLAADRVADDGAVVDHAVVHAAGIARRVADHQTVIKRAATHTAAAALRTGGRVVANNATIQRASGRAAAAAIFAGRNIAGQKAVVEQAARRRPHLNKLNFWTSSSCKPYIRQHRCQNWQ